jgi:hypothetical protein
MDKFHIYHPERKLLQTISFCILIWWAKKRRETADRKDVLLGGGGGERGTECKMKQVHPQFYSHSRVMGTDIRWGRMTKLVVIFRV